VQLKALARVGLFAAGGLIAALPWLGPATAQPTSCPNQTPAFTAGGNVFGRLASQWNQYFAAKVDSVNGVLCNPTIVGGSSFGQIPAHTVLANPTGGVAVPVPTPSVAGTLTIDSGSVDLTPSGVTAGSYSKLTVDAYGRATAGGTADCATDVLNAGCLPSDNVWAGNNTFATVYGTIRTVAGTTDTLLPSDCGKSVIYTSSSPVTVTTFASAAPVSGACAMAIVQKGTGSVTIANGAGATQVSAHSCTKTFGQYALLSLYVDGEAPSEWLIGGDCSP